MRKTFNKGGEEENDDDKNKGKKKNEKVDKNKKKGKEEKNEGDKEKEQGWRVRLQLRAEHVPARACGAHRCVDEQQQWKQQLAFEQFMRVCELMCLRLRLRLCLRLRWRRQGGVLDERLLQHRFEAQPAGALALDLK